MSKKSLKGGAFEREFSKKLSLWYTERERDDIFWRTSQSGGRATQRRKSNLSTVNSAGDIGYLDDLGKSFVDSTLVELKRGYSDELDLLKIIDKPNNKRHNLLEWWGKAMDEASQTRRDYVWLIIRRDFCEPVIVISNETYYRHIEWNGKPDPNVLILTLSLSEEVGALKIMLLDSFLEWIDPGFFKVGTND